MTNTILDKQRQIREIIACGKSPKYFINSYVKIQHPIRGTVTFTTYPFQDDVVDDLQKHRYNVIVKSRQLGISTVAAAYALWLALFHRDKNIVCIATKLATAQNFIKKVKVAFNSLPKWLILKPKVGDSMQHIAFGNGSSIRALPRSEDVGRSEAVSLLIIDEAAHIEGFDALWAAILPTLSAGGNVCMLSSPKGASGVFHRTYVDAVAGTNGWNPIELMWDVHPERDEKWYEEEKKKYSEKEWAQEYACDFLGAGDTYISGQDIEWLKSISRSPSRRDGPQGQVWIWSEPQRTHNYIISADVARGDSTGDYSTFHVFDNTEGEIAAEYMGHIRPDEFGKLLDTWGRFYCDALMAPELNTYGHHAITVLQHRDYPNFYYPQKEKNPNFYPGPDDIPGFNNQGKKRELILARMEEVIRNRLVKCYSTRFINQLVSFVDSGRGTKIQARKGTHDDLIISFAIGASIMNLGSIDESARLMAWALVAATNKTSTQYVRPDGRAPASNAYADAYAVLNRRAIEAPYSQTQPLSDAERDFGARLPEDVRRTLGGLGWLYK